MRAISSRRSGVSSSGVVRDLAEVEIEDVLAVVLRRRAEPDVAAHAPRARERRVEPLDRDVRRADEVDLRAERPRRRQPQAHLADAARDDVDGVEERVDPVRAEPAHERRVVDAVHHDEQLVQGELALAAHHPREDALVRRGCRSSASTARYGDRRSGARCSNIRSRHARVSITRSPLGLIAPYGP